jgi:hypothetical protein
MAPPAPNSPSPDELGPAVEHARDWLLARVVDLLDNGCEVHPTLLPEVARFITTATETLRHYERLAARLSP